jgi:magnesium chelatase family protein
LPSVLSAKRQGRTEFFIPAENSFELEYIPNITIHPIQHFQEVVEYFVYGKEIITLSRNKEIQELQNTQTFEVDFEHIKGQIIAKRALAIAAAGFHNALMIGAPGSGKTMLSKAMKSILPPLNFSEILEVSQIYSVVGKLNKQLPLITQRPFRQIHHTASKFSIIGGGTQLTPGEVSLAHKGILFFDELTEFPRETLEVLRQPLEDRVINISRVSGSVEYPANFMFIASMNPCKCGYYKDREKSCTCSSMEIKRYQSKISGPLLDRIDMILEIPREKIDTLLDHHNGENSEAIRKKVVQARSLQQDRFKGTTIKANAHMTAKEIQVIIPLTSTCKDFLFEAANKLNLSGRVVHRTIKLARTIADMNAEDTINTQHLAEAIQYRSRTMFIDEE